MDWSANQTGWKTYDDDNINISYINFDNVSQSYAYNKKYHNTLSKLGNIKFNFIGSKLRIIGVQYSSASSNIIIKIDNKIINSFSQKNNTTKYQTLDCEITNLIYTEHFVEMYNTNGTLYLDALDIDDSGKLKPYNQNLYRYLIKQNSDYYSVKDDYYHNDTDLYDEYKLSTLNVDNFDDYGINDLSSIHSNALNKLIDNKYNIAMLK